MDRGKKRDGKMEMFWGKSFYKGRNFAHYNLSLTKAFISLSIFCLSLNELQNKQKIKRFLFHRRRQWWQENKNILLNQIQKLTFYHLNVDVDIVFSQFVVKLLYKIWSLEMKLIVTCIVSSNRISFSYDKLVCSYELS